MKRILIIDDARDRAAWLKASLELAGFDVVGLLAWEQVDEHSIQAALADVVIVDADAPGRDTLEQISLMSTTLEKPLVVLSAQNDQHSIQEAMRAGVSAYVAHTVKGEDLSGIIHVAAARFAEHKRLRDELKEAKSQLVERKLVDRAKSILMADHGYSEPDAYKRMRSMAMSKGKRLVEIETWGGHLGIMPMLSRVLRSASWFPSLPRYAILAGRPRLSACPASTAGSGR